MGNSIIIMVAMVFSNRDKYMKLKMANENLREKYWDTARAWSCQQDWAYYRTDEFPSVKGVAEFLANQDGYTVFESYVGRNYDKI